MSLAMSSSAEVKTLDSFYAHLDQAASVLKAKADLETQQSDLLSKEARKGFELFGNIAGGYQKSPFAREPFGRFFDPTVRLGLRYPLLGSAEKQQRAVGDAATQVKIEDIRYGWSQRLAALFLEENYAAYWSAQMMLALNDAYIRLRNKGIESILHKRSDAGLLLMSDYFEFLSAFEQADRSHLEFNSNKDQALTRLTYLTNTIIAPFKAIKPSLDQISNDLATDINQPDLEIIQAQIDNLQVIRSTETWRGIDSDISAAVFGGPAIPHPSPDSAQFGYGGMVGFNFRMPLEIISFRKHERSRINSELISFQTEYINRAQELNLEFRSTLNRYQQVSQQIQFQSTRLNAARESVRERYLRLQAIDGDVIEKYIQSINLYYRTAIEYLEAETEQWKLHIRLRQYVAVQNQNNQLTHDEISINILLEPLQQVEEFLGKQVAVEPNSRVLPIEGSKQLSPDKLVSASDGFAIYVWNYDKFMSRPEIWKHSQAMQVNRVLLSLNEEQITSVASNPQVLNNFIADAHRYGIEVELLLGDPNWILPSERLKLIEIIKQLGGIDFAGLHLDIEPDQLDDKLVGEERLKELIETIHLAKIVSPWPVGISVHPRYLENESASTLCVICQLQQIGVTEIAVMYYSLNIQNIVTTLKLAMNKYPNLIFSLAQSLERELGPENSYVHKPKQFFKNAMQQLQSQLQASNYGGLIIQSWQDWDAYHHEDPI